MSLEKLKYGRLSSDEADGPASPTSEEDVLLDDKEVGLPTITLAACTAEELDNMLLQPTVYEQTGGPSPGDAVVRRDPFKFHLWHLNDVKKRQRWWKAKRLSGRSCASQGNQRRHNRRKERLNTELLLGAMAGDLHEVDRCLGQGASPNATCGPTWTSASHVAALLGFPGVLALLLEKGADARLRTRDGASLLHLAAWGGDAACAEVAARAAPDLLDGAVRLATNQVLGEWRDSSQHDHAALAAKLPEIPTGSTPLHVASQRANIDVIRVLLQHRADVSAADEDGLAPLDVVGEAIEPESPQGHDLEGSIRALLEAGAWTAVGDEEDEESNVKQYRASPVHTAVKLRDVAAIRLLAQSEVSPLVFDLQGDTPVHLAVANKSGDCLKVLLQAYETGDDSIVDVYDIRGQTALHQAVSDGWLEGVCILLEAGADVSVKNKAQGLTPVHMAAEKARLDILQEFIAMDDIDVSTLNLTDRIGDTPLALAVESRSLPCVKLLLEEGADVSKAIGDNSTVLHRAAKYNEPEILEELLKGAKSSHRAILDATVGLTDETALHLAARAGNLQCCGLLLDAGCGAAADKGATTPLHLAAEAGHADVTRLLLERRPEVLELEDAEDRTPLLLACKGGRRECARLLVEAGADLSVGCRAASGGKLVTAMDYLFAKVPRPVDLLREVFDGAVSVNEFPADDERCEVRLDFSVLAPGGRSHCQMSVMDAFVNTGNTFQQTELLLHPLVRSFLFLKWRQLSATFYVILADFFLFVTALTALCVDLYVLPDRGHGPSFTGSEAVWRAATLLFLAVFFLQEVAYAACFPKFYLTELESWLKWTCFVLAAITACVDKDDTEGWRRSLAAVAILLSWMEFMFLLSRLPTLSYFVLMFFKVTTNVCKVILTFAFLFLGFTLSFMILFSGEPPFTTPLNSLTKVIVMMSGELEYTDMFGDESARLCARLVFVAFVFMMGVVMMNLMVGVAVSDIGVLESKGLIGRLRKQVDFLRMLEYFLYNDKFLRVLPAKVAAKVTALRNVKDAYEIHPGRTDSDVADILPADVYHDIMVHVLEKKRSDSEYTVKDVYDKICEIACKTPRGKDDVLDVLARMSQDLKDIRLELSDGSGDHPSTHNTPRKLDTLLEKVDDLSSTLHVLLNQLSRDQHVINIP